MSVVFSSKSGLRLRLMFVFAGFGVIVSVPEGVALIWCHAFRLTTIQTFDFDYASWIHKLGKVSIIGGENIGWSVVIECFIILAIYVATSFIRFGHLLAELHLYLDNDTVGSRAELSKLARIQSHRLQSRAHNIFMHNSMISRPENLLINLMFSKSSWRSRTHHKNWFKVTTILQHL